jgi:hypothetical protein
MREKEWDIAARVRERALTDAREQIGLLMKELAADRSALRARDARIADLESCLEDQRRHLAIVIARTVSKNRALASAKPRRKTRARTRVVTKKRVVLKRPRGRARR